MKIKKQSLFSMQNEKKYLLLHKMLSTDAVVNGVDGNKIVLKNGN